jgi:hypothetical protein
MDSLRKAFVLVFAILRLFITIKTFADVSDCQQIVIIPTGGGDATEQQCIGTVSSGQETFYFSGDQ